VRLTEHGIALLDRAEGLMTQLKSIEQDMLGQAKEPSGEVRIALPPTTAQVLAPLIVAEVRKKFPRITLHIREGISGSIHDWVLEGRVDLALLYNPEAGTELQITPVLREPIFLIVPTSHMPLPSSMTKNGRFRLKQIGSVPLILPSHSHSLRTLLERLSREHRLSLNIVNEIDGMRATKGMVEAGLGYTAFSYAGVYEEVSAGTLAIIPFTPALQWTLAIVERHSAASRALFEVKRCIEKQVYVLLERGFSQGQLL
jgi:LysR family nitrogen assimilation transcriptional regulator